jgi:phosphoribosylformylglycinamidine (FGAM) synthase-like enzyme
LAESCFNPDGLLGATVNLPIADSLTAAQHRQLAICATLFNESQSRIIISVPAEHLETTMSNLQQRGLAHSHLGSVTPNELRIQVDDESFSWSISGLYDVWWNAIRRAVESDSAERLPSL